MLITTAGVGIKNVWVNNKENVQHVLNVQHILDSIDFISSYICFIQQGGGGGGQTHKTKGRGRKALPLRQWDTGLRTLAPFPYLQTDRCNILSRSSSVRLH